VSKLLTPEERAKIIARRDPSFKKLTKVVGPPPPRRNARVDSRFPNLARSITFQLLATKAADTIHQRVIDLCEGSVSPESIIVAGHANLRGVGLSNAKAAAMLDLAACAGDGRVRFAHHGRMSDDEVLEEVVSVRGLGPWTAQMYLMHTLGRHDIWPSSDLGVRHGWSLIHDLDEMISVKDLHSEGAIFEGVRSDVAWYCWEAVHLSRTR
jgi:3-methyladenine DNA glycosylase/8-oxoguanine DNA glycosylase